MFPSSRQSRQILAAVGCAILAFAAFSVDVAVATWFRERGLPGDLKRLITVAEVFGFGISVFLIVVTAATLDPRGWRLGAYLATSSLGAGLLADVVKLAVPRQRPSTNIPAVVADSFAQLGAINSADYSHAWQSFPSAHTATAVGLACGLAVCYPRGRFLFTLFAILAATQRLQSQAHYLSDVFAGAALAFLWVTINDRWPAWRTLWSCKNSPTASL